MSYQKLNQVTLPFTFHITHCDDSLQDIDTETNYFIAVDMDSGYWKVLEEYVALKRLALFIPDGNWWCRVMPMGDLNVASTFVVMMMKLKMEWDTLAEEFGLKNVASKIIVNDVLLYGHTADHILEYFRTVLDVLKHHCTTLKPKRCKCFQ